MWATMLSVAQWVSRCTVLFCFSETQITFSCSQCYELTETISLGLQQPFPLLSASNPTQRKVDLNQLSLSIPSLTLNIVAILPHKAAAGKVKPKNRDIKAQMHSQRESHSAREACMLIKTSGQMPFFSCKTGKRCISLTDYCIVEMLSLKKKIW